ncbi:hypothetical protein [Hydrogenophaga sp. 5NK40-0174]|uniref:hypothetical protein n=1 Tax=Hydrogenophaga sp. 5NK40-0174 TaxID=3127649 RepID=UPI00310BC258
MKPRHLLTFAVLVMAAICASLGWIGIVDQHLTTGGRGGIKTQEGLSAVISGWLWMAAALGFVGISVSASAWRNLLWLGLVLLYLVGQGVYWMSPYAPPL